ncbi:MAG TPA: PDZ domain-containing protein, partial [Aggregatilineales bacterium]|nr:PDZ domain-containing protein [Aggregatilineales bacterium]
MPRNSRLRASFFTAVIIVVIAASIPLLTQAQTSTPPAFLGVRTVVNSQGTQIVEVIPNSPAANGGLQVGDVIVAIENAPITGDYPIDAALAKLKPGDKAQFTLARNGQVLNMIVTLGSLPTLIPTSNLAAPTLGGATEGASPVPPTTYMGVGLEERTNG